MYNNNIRSVTKLTPFEVLTGHIETNNPFSVEEYSNTTQENLKDHTKQYKAN